MALTGTLDVTTSDDEVEFTFDVTNDGDGPVKASFSNACTTDVAVFDGDSEVWRWSNGQMFAQMMQQISFDPGETVSETHVWESASPGDYEAVATLEANDADVEARATFSV